MVKKIIALVLAALCLVNAANPSGKAWLSGYTTDSGSIADFASYRSAPQDIAGTWHCHQDWGFIEAGGCRNYMGGKPDAGLDGPLNWGWAKNKPQWHAVGLLPTDFNSNLLACSQGKYDSHFKKLGQSIVDADLNRANVFLRLGWEGNGDWYPWGAAKHSTDYFKNNAQRSSANYAGCFRKAVNAIRTKAKNVKFSWNLNKDGGADELKMYPGDAYVDVVDVDYYNANPLSTTLGGFRSHSTAKYSGDTIGRGIKLWLDFARNHGKKLAVSEWGANQGDYSGYIEGMFQFFRDNSARIAWESYYNQRPSGHYNYRLYEKSGGKPNPSSSAKYKALWKKSSARSLDTETGIDEEYEFDPSVLELAPEDYLYEDGYYLDDTEEYADHSFNDGGEPHELDEVVEDDAQELEESEDEPDNEADASYEIPPPHVYSVGDEQELEESDVPDNEADFSYELPPPHVYSVGDDQELEESDDVPDNEADFSYELPPPDIYSVGDEQQLEEGGEPDNEADFSYELPPPDIYSVGDEQQLEESDEPDNEADFSYELPPPHVYSVGDEQELEESGEPDNQADFSYELPPPHVYSVGDEQQLEEENEDVPDNQADFSYELPPPDIY